MKTLLKFCAVTAGVGWVGFAFVRAEAPPSKIQIATDCEIWVDDCRKDFDSIKVGMTREQVEAKLNKDGGIQSRFSPIRFTHPSCRLFKIDVEFERDARDIVGKADKVTKVSNPYIQGMVMD